MEGIGTETATRNAETRSVEARQAERAQPGPTDEQRGQITGSVDATTHTEAARVADTVTGGDQDRVEAAAKGKGPAKDKGGPGLRDGDFLHNPRTLTPNQVRDLEKLQQDPSLHPTDQQKIKDFLEDYRKNRDRLFPDSPSPYPRPYPAIPPDRVG